MSLSLTTSKLFNIMAWCGQILTVQQPDFTVQQCLCLGTDCCCVSQPPAASAPPRKWPQGGQDLSLKMQRKDLWEEDCQDLLETERQVILGGRSVGYTAIFLQSD